MEAKIEGCPGECVDRHAIPGEPLLYRARLITRWGVPVGGVMCGIGVFGMLGWFFVAMFALDAAGVDRPAARLIPGASSWNAAVVQDAYKAGQDAISTGFWVCVPTLLYAVWTFIFPRSAMNKALAAYCSSGRLQGSPAGALRRPYPLSDREWAVLYHAWQAARPRSAWRVAVDVVGLLIVVATVGAIYEASVAGAISRMQSIVIQPPGEELVRAAMRQAFWQAVGAQAVLWAGCAVLGSVAVLGRELMRYVRRCRLLLKLHDDLGDLADEAGPA